MDAVSNHVHFTLPVDYYVGMQRAGNKPGLYRLENVRAFLDEPGEWYYDRHAGRIDYLPRDGECPSSSGFQAVASSLKTLLVVKGDAAGSQSVRNVTFRGITFRDVDATTDVKDPTNGSQGSSHVGAALKISGAHTMLFEGCRFCGLDGFAADVVGGSRGVVFRRCVFRDLGAGAIRIDGGGVNAHPALRTRENVVEDCEIGDYGLDWASAVGVLVMRSDRNRIVHNWIHDGYYTAISAGWTWGYNDSVSSGNVIVGNRIEHIGKGVLNDMGGIYLLGPTPGTIVRGNVVHGISSWSYGGHALYCDEGTQGVLIEKNVFYDAPDVFNIHYGREITFRNNIVALGRHSLFNTGAVENHVTLYMYGNVFYAEDCRLENAGTRWRADQPYEYRISPHEKHLGRRQDHAIADWNLFYRKGVEKEVGMKGLVDGRVNIHSLWGDPKFADPARGDFTLAPDSPAFALGFEAFDGKTAGPRK